MHAGRTRSGYSLIEVVVILGIIGAMAAMAIPQLSRWASNFRVKSAARSAADAFLLAKSEAIRTGNNHVVFFGPPGTTDPAGTVITDDAGNPVPILVLDDGPPGAANCNIDAGEARRAIQPERGVSWGVTVATAKAPTDDGGGAYTTGSTFTDPANNPIHWVLFRPDGIPVAFTGGGGNCDTIATTGTGAGGLYLTNGTFDYAVVLAPLGGVRVHGWRHESSTWGG